MTTPIIVLIGIVSISQAQAAGFSNEELCKAGLALALDKSPRVINSQTGKGTRVLLSLKKANSDWDYRCDLNRGSKTVQLEAREINRSDNHLKHVIRYTVTNGGRSVEVTMKQHKGRTKSEKYQAMQLKG
ncbi:hypothetical protein BCU70_03350 [Vibrio sp. 10N.286.49.C2]|nr:hypothetical protein BCU70_03350 [Vibrio sp. 10N.286.49.C2]PMH55777.1 hypothetical protein BCU66_08945 [Vibrio sp. 10N.286.49.B1]PMH80042.1 hypothetical protein BCU58_04075 [Vibrio sp. 10N.286.48.B7]